MAHGSGAARSESLYRAFADVRPVPGCTFSGGLAKPFFNWQSTRAARRIAGVAENARFAAYFMCATPARFGHSRSPFRLISLHERRSRDMTARIGGRFRPPSRLISPHERRSRNMMARIERRELSAHIKLHSNGEAIFENFIPTAICTADVPTGMHFRPPGRGVQWLACPAPSYRCMFRRV